MKLTNDQLKDIPGLGETEATPANERMVYLHLFLGGCHWYIAEYDPKTRVMFGFAVLFENYQDAEWGFIPLDDLVDTKWRGFMEVEYNPYFRPMKAGEIEHIKEHI